MDLLKKAVFGPKIEKRALSDDISSHCEQISLFNEAETESRREETETVTVPEHKRKAKRSREQIIAELPVEEVVHKVEDTTCDICDSEMKAVGKEFCHDELMYVKARMYVVKHYVEVVKCVSCGVDESQDAEHDDVVKEHFRKGAAPAMLIPRSFCSPELLSGSVIHADETVVQVLNELGRKAKTKSRMWVYCNPKSAGRYIVLYDYRQTRSGENAVSFLGDYSGYLVGDGYDGYNKLTTARRCGGCLRSKLHDNCLRLSMLTHMFAASLLTLYPPTRSCGRRRWLRKAFRQCDRLFALESEYDGRDAGGKQVREPITPDERHRHRSEEVKPLLDDFFEWLATVNPVGRSALASAVQYALNEKKYLYGFFCRPRDRDQQQPRRERHPTFRGRT